MAAAFALTRFIPSRCIRPSPGPKQRKPQQLHMLAIILARLMPITLALIFPDVNGKFFCFSTC